MEALQEMNSGSTEILQNEPKNVVYENHHYRELTSLIHEALSSQKSFISTQVAATTLLLVGMTTAFLVLTFVFWDRNKIGSIWSGVVCLQSLTSTIVYWGHGYCFNSQQRSINGKVSQLLESLPSNP